MFCGCSNAYADTAPNTHTCPVCLGLPGALLPLVRQGDETRRLIEPGRPVHARSRVRIAVRHVLLAIAWIVIAMYGLYLVTVGTEMAA